jgi:hypothetical protein
LQVIGEQISEIAQVGERLAKVIQLGLCSENFDFRAIPSRRRRDLLHNAVSHNSLAFGSSAVAYRGGGKRDQFRVGIYLAQSQIVGRNRPA